MLRRNLNVLLCAIFLLAASLQNIRAFKTNAAEQLPGGFTQIDFSSNFQAKNDVTFGYYSGRTQDGLAKAFTVKASTKKLKPIVAFGNYVTSGTTLSDIISAAEDKGYNVVAGINTDVYDLSYHTPNGLLISSGRLLSTPSDTYYNTEAGTTMGTAVAFYKDGRAVYGSALMRVRATSNDKTLRIRHINKPRKSDEAGIYIYTEEYAEELISAKEGINVALSVDLGGIQFAKALNGTVESINIISDNDISPIPKNSVIISVGKNNPSYSYLKELTVGTEFKITVEAIESEIDFEQVTEAFSVFHALKTDKGKTMQEDSELHPRSALGMDNDGNIGLAVFDGRQTGWSQGARHKTVTNFMEWMGFETILNMDGGGSSILAISTVGGSPVVVNRPSDNQERANSVYLLLVEDIKPPEEAEVLRLSAGNGTLAFDTVKVLPGSNLKISASLFDKNGANVGIATQANFSSSDTTVAQVDNSGFVAVKKQGQVDITANYLSMSATISIIAEDAAGKLIKILPITAAVGDIAYITGICQSQSGECIIGGNLLGTNAENLDIQEGTVRAEKTGCYPLSATYGDVEINTVFLCGYRVAKIIHGAGIIRSSDIIYGDTIIKVHPAVGHYIDFLTVNGNEHSSINGKLQLHDYDSDVIIEAFFKPIVEPAGKSRAYLYILSGAGALIIAGAATTFIIKKKKRS